MEKKKIIDRLGNEEIIKYTYDFNNKLLKVELTNGMVEENEYEEGKIKSSTYYHKEEAHLKLYNKFDNDNEEYNEFGEKIYENIIKEGNIKTIYQCAYDRKGNLENVIGINNDENIIYDRIGKITGKTIIYGEDRLDINNIEDKENNKYNSSLKISQKVLENGEEKYKINNIEYTYNYDKKDNLLDKIEIKKEEEMEEEKIEYDKLKRIKRIENYIFSLEKY